MSELEYTVLRLIINFVDALLFSVFMLTLFDRKFKWLPVLINSSIVCIISFMAFKIIPYLSKILFVIEYLVIVLIISLVSKKLLRISLLQSIAGTAFFLIIQMIIDVTYYHIFEFLELMNVPVYDIYYDRILLIAGSCYGFFIVGLSIIIINRFKQIFRFPSNMRIKSYIYIIVNIVLTLIILLFTFYIAYNNFIQKSVEYRSTPLIAVIFIAYFLLNIAYTKNVARMEFQSQELEYQKFYNQTLDRLVSGLQRFKHGYDNTLSCIKGYIDLKQWDNLENYVNEIVGEKSKISMIESVVISRIKNAGILGLLVQKREYAVEKGIILNIKVDNEINDIHMKQNELCESLGILLDNAVEAALESEEKYVLVTISNLNGIIAFSIVNSVLEKPDIDKMFSKRWSTKGEDRGMGLWILKSIVKKYKNVAFNTFVDEKRVTQEIVIMLNE